MNVQEELLHYLRISIGVSVGGSIGISKILMIFYVIDRGLSGKLSCTGTDLVF